MTIVFIYCHNSPEILWQIQIWKSEAIIDHTLNHKTETADNPVC